MDRLTFYLFFIAQLLILSCSPDDATDYPQEMRDFVQNISFYARNIKYGFIVIPQNGQELLTTNGISDGSLEDAYSSAINGVGREDLFYGYIEDNEVTPQAEQEYMLGFLDLAEAQGLEVLVTDYCSTQAKVDSSYIMSEQRQYISFAADQRDLSSIPPYPTDPYNMNSNDIIILSQARNFLYLINTEQYATKSAFIEALQQTDYDVLIIDLFFDGADILDAQDVASLSTKASGGMRLILAYCSIGEAEDYRYYWQDEWVTDPPEWLGPENPAWSGNYKVRYWNPEWQAIIYNNDQSYIKKILDTGFDGVYLDIIDAFEYWQSL